jgi:hypothetical protein
VFCTVTHGQKHFKKNFSQFKIKKNILHICRMGTGPAGCVQWSKMRINGQQTLAVGIYASATTGRGQEDPSSHNMGCGISAAGWREPKKILFLNGELNLLWPVSGCPLQAGTGHGLPGQAPGRC